MKQTLLQKSIELNERLLEALIGPHEGLVKDLIELKEEAKNEIGKNESIPDTVEQYPAKPSEVENSNQMKPNADFEKQNDQSTPKMPEAPKSTNMNELI